MDREANTCTLSGHGDGFDTIETAIETTPIPAQGDSLAEAYRLADRPNARITDTATEFASLELRDTEDATSFQAWLRTRAGLSPRAAMQSARVARRLAQLPVTRAAWTTGVLSGGQVEVILANLNDRRARLFADHETALIEHLAPLDMVELVTVMQEWARRADALDEPGPGEEPESWVSYSRTMDGRGELRGSFAAGDATTVETALDLATSNDAEGETRTPQQRRADSLVDIMRFFLDHHSDPPGRRHRPHVNVVVRAEDLTGEQPEGHTIDGIPLHSADLAAWVCDSVLRRILMAASATVDFGRTTKIVSPSLHNAVAVRDQHCRWPGCDRRGRHCDAHHVQHWHHGGSTSIDNLVLLCRRHHHKIHRTHWHAKLLPDGHFEITRPDGTTLTSDPPRRHHPPPLFNDE